jgi:hypothetical protein
VIERLSDEDHYLLALIDLASHDPVKPSKLSRWDFVKLIFAALGVPLGYFVRAHVDNPATAKLIDEGSRL